MGKCKIFISGYCPDPTPVNERILSTTMPTLSDGTYAVGTEAQLACNTGYTIFGTYPSVCAQPGIWIPPAFECIPDDNGQQNSYFHLYFYLLYKRKIW